MKITIEINTDCDVKLFNAEISDIKKRVLKHIKLHSETRILKQVDFFNNQGTHNVKIEFNA